ncbi:hypothetical protein [Alkaliphilus crotonatoxidans]
MKPIKTTLIMGGIPVTEFQEYFTALGGQTQDRSLYMGKGWRVSLYSYFEALGSFSVERTKIVFEIEADKSDQMIEDFRLAFLRAGG